MHNKSFFLAVILIVLAAVTGCSDDNEREVVIVHDSIDTLLRDDSFEFELSNGGSRVLASQFVVLDQTEISELVWTGVLDTIWGGGANGIVNDEALFRLTIYGNDDDGVVGDHPIFESLVVAGAKVIPGNLGGNHRFSESGAHTFSYDFEPGIRLQPGRYWMSIAGAGVLNAYFYWAVEDGGVGANNGRGGAVRQDISLDWQPTGFGDEMTVAKGFSLRLKGWKTK